MVHREHIAPRQPRYGELEHPLPSVLQHRLNDLRLLPLYIHQTHAINLLRTGKNVMVATPAASGKSLCYHVPVLEALLTRRGSCALYLFPTKALAQNQLKTLNELGLGLFDEPRWATFDGDTPSAERAEIRRAARIVITNPDMLHLGILPNHAAWGRLLRQLRYVVVDEAHVYRGVFGSHVAQILRRLRRLCALYGSSPQFIFCSATIANPGEHAQSLSGLPCEAVTENGSPHGGKEFIFWNPPLLDEAKSARRSANTEATLLLSELMRQGIPSLVFTRTRRLTELVYMYVRDRLLESDPALAGRVKPYRAGYLPEDRRRIEEELFQGRLLGVVATTALELGIDVGNLGATILTGYPGSIASAWQQAGRSGRGVEDSLSFLIGLDNPLDQYLMRHPDSFFGKPHENALINPQNPYILKPHLLCAAYEMPLSSRDDDLFGPAFRSVVAQLEEEGWLHPRRGQHYPAPALAYPAQEINIRSASSQNYVIVDADRGVVLETVDAAAAFWQIHPGAIYLHQGESYLVIALDILGRAAQARLIDAPYYTQAKDLTEISIVRVLEEKRVGQARVYLGQVEVTNTVVGFKRKRQFTDEVIGEEPLDLPPRHFPTVALWFDLAAGSERRIAAAALDWAGGLHAAEHAAIGLLPLFALCDRNDIGGVSTPFHPDTGRAQIFIYDGHPGGVGIAEKGYELIEDLWRATLNTLRECPCQEGCPSCVQSPKCGNNNQPLDKEAAKVILEELLKGPYAP